MINSKEKIVNILIEKGNELFKQPYKHIEFTKNKEADNLLNNLKDFPHAFVLACVMDRQIKAERAWLIPYKISEEIKGFEFSMLLKVNQEEQKYSKEKAFIDSMKSWVKIFTWLLVKFIMTIKMMLQISGRVILGVQP